MKMVFEYEILEKIGTVSEAGTMAIELNLISYSGAEPKFDLRKWRTIADERTMQKGITMTADELRSLRDLLNSVEL